MHSEPNPYAAPMSAADASVDARSEFIRKTYMHLAWAILAFAALEAALLSIPGIDNAIMGPLAAKPSLWLIVLGAAMFVSHIANKWAHGGASRNMQYAGLGLYIVVQAVIFLPMMIMAQSMTPSGDIIIRAGAVTLALFAAISMIAFTTRKDFSFMGGMLKLIGIIAMVAIVASFFLPFELGMGFSILMAIFAGGIILYQTSNIIHHYNTNQYVAASLGLFSSVTLMLWYVMRIFMSRD